MKSYNSKFKANVAIEAIKNELTVEQISRKYDVHLAQVVSWKKEFLQGAYIIFESENKPLPDNKEEFVQQLYAQVGDIKVAYPWLNNKLK